MRLHAAALVAVLGVPAAAEEIPPAWMQKVGGAIEAQEYEVTLRDAGYQAPNRAHGFRSRFDGRGLRAEPRAEMDAPWAWGLDWVGYGRGSRSWGVPEASLSPRKSRIDLRRGSLLEWYENGPEGLKQGFELTAPPQDWAERIGAAVRDAVEVAEHLVHLELALSGTLYPVLSPDGQAIDFVAEGGARVLRYAGLAVTDARGREIPAYMEGCPGGIRLVLDVGDAAYPITIDPMTTNPAWTVESNQTTAEFGRSVATAGDVNGDGYSDLLVGAPFYDNGSTDEGRAFLFLGSASGPLGLASWTAESDQTGARFGSSLATAGDVDGDGFSDFLIGAPFYDNGSTDEGMVFLYRGAASPTPISTTPAWTKESDQGSARFGACVATAGDVDGDGYSDVLVGATHFDNGSTDEGRVFLYRGSASGLSTSAAWTAESDQASAQFGLSAATAGDVDGDGYADVVIGAPFFDSGIADAGRFFMYRGGGSGLSPSPAITMTGGQTGGEYGYSVATAGDVNGDGYSDVIVGVPFWDGGSTDSGRFDVLLGGPTAPYLHLGFLKNGVSEGATLGWSVGTAGDVNGDGYADVVAASPFYFVSPTVGGGRVEVYAGSKNGLVDDIYWLELFAQANAAYGYQVATAGDTNGDGYSDMVIGSPWLDNGSTNEGRAWVYLGGAEFGPSTTEAWSETADDGGTFAEDIASAGDVNGDGFADIIVGEPFGSSPGGNAHVYHGAATIVQTAPNWTGSGIHPTARYGNSVASAGDVNGDGYGDVVVGAPNSDGTAAVYVYHGSPTGLSPTPSTVIENSLVQLFGHCVASAGDMNADGFDDVIVGAPRSPSGVVFIFLGSATGLVTPQYATISSATTDQFGLSVASAGDVNADGYADIVIGAPRLASDQGRIHVYLGGPDGLAPVIRIEILGAHAGALFGWSVASAGDVNGDGRSDVVVGAPGQSITQTNEGAASVFYGTATGTSTTPAWTKAGGVAHGDFGMSVSGAGDVNGDGLADVIVGDPDYPVGAGLVGRLQVFAGVVSGPVPSILWVQRPEPFSAFGARVAGAGDVNGDGYADILSGAMYIGTAFAYYGNDGRGAALVPEQRTSDDLRPIDHGGTSDLLDAFRLGLRARTPFGRAKAKLEWEVKPLGTPFGINPSGQTPGVVDTGLSGASIETTIGFLRPATPYHWRVRVRYDRVTVPFAPHSRWVTRPWAGWNETMVRTRDGDPAETGPIVIDKSGGSISMAWSPSCSPADTDYAIYEGQLGSFTTHVPRLCSTGGVAAATLAPSSGNRYYLVVPHDGAVERSYGQDSAGLERPPSASACRPQSLGICQ